MGFVVDLVQVPRSQYNSVWYNILSVTNPDNYSIKENIFINKYK